MTETFQKEITWVTMEFDVEQKKSVPTEHTKTATFKELNRCDKNQHKLHFKLMSIFEGVQNVGSSEVESISTDGIYDLTTKAIKVLFEKTEEFNEKDRDEVLNDSAALLSFGLWLFKEKFTPFLSSFKMS